MLNLLGRRYVIEHAVAFYNERQKREVLHIYITDALKVIAENTAWFSGGDVINARYYDIMHPKPTMSAANVRARIKAKLRG